MRKRATPEKRSLALEDLKHVMGAETATTGTGTTSDPVGPDTKPPAN